MNIPDIVGASVASLAFIGGGIGLYTSSQARDAVLDQRVEDLLTIAEKGSQRLTELSDVVNTLEVKQQYNESTQRELTVSIRDLTQEVRTVNTHLLMMKGHDEKILLEGL